MIVLKNEVEEMRSNLPHWFSQSLQTEKPRKTLLETFTVIYALEK